MVGDNELLGLCTITATADGYRDASVDLAAPIVLSNGALSTDRILNLVMLSDNAGGDEACRTPLLAPDAIDPDLSTCLFLGKVGWIDQGTGNEILAISSTAPPTGRFTNSDVAITSTSPAITGFTTADVTGTGPAPQPEPVITGAGAITDTSSGGMWNLSDVAPRQVFGQTTYSFDDTNPGGKFATATVSFRIDENGASGRGITASTVQRELNGSYSVYLQPNPGSITGEIAIVSSTASLDGFVLTATPPSGPAITVPLGSLTLDTTITDPPTRNVHRAPFTIADAAAGTWTLSVSPASGHTPATAVTTSVFVDAGGATSAGRISTFVESGSLTVRVRDTSTGVPTGLPISVEGVRPSVRLGTGAVQMVDVDGNITFTDLEVPATGFPATFNVTITMPGYDTTRARVTVNAGAENTRSAADIPVPVAAGDRDGDSATVLARLPAYGSILGAVVGDIDGAAGAATEPLRLPQLLLSLTEVVDNGDGTFTRDLIPDTALAARGFSITPASREPARPTDPELFRVTGPPGCYEFGARFPGFANRDTISSSAFLEPCPGGGFPIVNDDVTALVNAADPDPLTGIRLAGPAEHARPDAVRTTVRRWGREGRCPTHRSHRRRHDYEHDHEPHVHHVDGPGDIRREVAGH